MTQGLSFNFEKASSNGRYIRGFASVTDYDGKPVEDWQGDVMDISVARTAAHEFALNARVAKRQHKGEQIGDVVESIIIDDALAKSLGIADKRRGWYIVMDIHDTAVRKDIMAGKLKGFSIGGRGVRVPIVE